MRKQNPNWQSAKTLPTAAAIVLPPLGKPSTYKRARNIFEAKKTDTLNEVAYI